MIVMDPEAIRDLFCDLGPVAGELMFALAARGELYLKADNGTAPEFEAAGSRPFTYEKDGRTAQMSYWLLPDAAVDDPEEAARWGRLALEAARRAAARKPRTKLRRGARRSAEAPRR